MDLQGVFAFAQVLLYRSVYVALPFLICLTLVLLLDRLAPSLGLLDKPDARKHHEGAVPVIGGPAMYLSIAIASVLLAFHVPVVVFLALGAVLIGLGIADDRYDLRPRHRLIVQAGVAVAMVWLGDVRIEQLGNLFGFGPVSLEGWVAVAFTVVCTIGVINAVNMIDGVDGLAGSLLLVSFLAMAHLSMSGDNPLGARMLGIFGGALLGFLCFNARVFVPRAAIFMGDSGSMLMGLILAWFLINMTQASLAQETMLQADAIPGRQAPISAVVAGWIFGLPLMDTVGVMIGRLRERRSPLAAGRDHLHHRLLDAGFSVNRTVLTMVGVHTALVIVGVLANHREAAEPFLFYGFVLIVATHALLTPKLLPTPQPAAPSSSR